MPTRTLRPLALASLATLGLASAATAGAITQTADLTWDGSFPGPGIDFAGFDDQGGTRELTGVSFGFTGSMEATFLFENLGTIEIASGEWEAVVTYTGVANFVGGGPLLGFGGIGDDGITGLLGAGTGGPFGEPGDPVVTHDVTGTIDIATPAPASSFAYFSGNDTVTAEIGAFTDIFFLVPPPPGGFINGSVTDASVLGTLELTYEYAVVPAPGVLAMLTVCGFARKRRRVQ